jgi:hypothetical protein
MGRRYSSQDDDRRARTTNQSAVENSFRNVISRLDTQSFSIRHRAVSVMTRKQLINPQASCATTKSFSERRLLERLETQMQILQIQIPMKHLIKNRDAIKLKHAG